MNEQIQHTAESFSLAEDPILILCECRESECTKRSELSRQEYEALRRYPTRFAQLCSHENQLFGRIVEQNERYLTVEAIGEAAIAATRLDPRRRPVGRAAGGA